MDAVDFIHRTLVKSHWEWPHGSENHMDDKDRADLEKLETLRDLALCGPEEKRDEAQKAYEELREKLFSNEQCETADQTNDTKELVNGR
jgi:hypothetical protein